MTNGSDGPSPAESARINRRELLKRGAVAGGTVLWATPVVQTIGMGTAHAATPSPTCTIYCLEWKPLTGTSAGGWDVGDGEHCLPCPADALDRLPPDIDEFTVAYDDAAHSYTVLYPDSYSLVATGDPTPDDLVNGSAAIRRARQVITCEFLTPADQEPGPLPGTTQITFKDWTARVDDRIELVIEHCI